MTVTKLPADTAARLLDYERHTLRKLRAEEAMTRNPDRLREYITFARLSIVCARRGYMLNI